MNCPYCDDSIHPMAKFCPKCGLPLSEDATLMGASIFDDSGPKRWMVAGGAVAIVAIAMSIGWMSSRRGSESAQVRRERVGHLVPAHSTHSTSLAPGGRPFAPLGQYAAPATSAAKPIATFGYKAQYAYTPPQRPQQVAPVMPPQPEPEAPRHLMAVDPFRKPKKVSVAVPSAEDPAIPGLPQLYMPQQYSAPGVAVPVAQGVPSNPAHNTGPYVYSPLLAPQPVEGNARVPADQLYPTFVADRDGTGARSLQSPSTPVAPSEAGPQVAFRAPVQDVQEDFVYDPVHETYVRRADRAQRPRQRGLPSTGFATSGR